MRQTPQRERDETASELVCRRTTTGESGTEWTFFEPDRDPGRRTTRWITASADLTVEVRAWR